MNFSDVGKGGDVIEALVTMCVQKWQVPSKQPQRDWIRCPKNGKKGQ